MRQVIKWDQQGINIYAIQEILVNQWEKEIDSTGKMKKDMNNNFWKRQCKKLTTL